MKARSPEPGPVATDRIIRLAIKVHRRLGPGLLETVYHQCLCWELQHDGVTFETEVPLPIVYEDVRIDKGFRADIAIGAKPRADLVIARTVPHLDAKKRQNSVPFVPMESVCCTCVPGLLPPLLEFVTGA
jgi:GxxExxY protein